MSTGILGTGSYLPERRVTNRELIERGIDSSDDWIVAHTGIRERRLVASDDATSDLAFRAAERALAAAQLDAASVDLIICATSTPDHLLPSTASLIQHRLGATCGAFDLNAGCSGFAHALLTGFALQQRGDAPHVLVIGADTYSRIIDWGDRHSAVFFGDGAGAVVLGPSSGREWLLASVCGSDGSRGDLIEVPAGGSRWPTTVERLEARQTCFRMDGRGVWDFAAKQTPLAVREVVRRAGLRMQDIDLFIPHQANARLVHMLADKLEVHQERVLVDVERWGNTASASIAIGLNEAARSGRLGPDSNLVLIGFGAGLAWCALCVRWQPGAD